MGTSEPAAERLVDSEDSCHLSLRVDWVFPNWNSNFQPLDDLDTPLEGGTTMPRRYTHKQGGLSRRYKSNPMMNHHQAEAVSRLRFLRDHQKLAFRHWLKSFVFDAFNQAASLMLPHHTKKIDDRTFRRRKIQLCRVNRIAVHSYVIKLHC